MFGLLIAALTVSATVPQQTDTTFAVSGADRIAVENYSGRVAVQTWDRQAVRVQARHSNSVRVRIRTTGSVVRVEPEARFGPAAGVELTITVPATFGIDVEGMFSSVTVENAGANVAVETTSGDIRVDGGNGRLHLESTQGSITQTNGRGRLQASTTNQGITVTSFDGEVNAETVNGPIQLERIRSGAVDASAVNGNLTYDGTVRDDGSYKLSTHNGDVVVFMPASANATISMATAQGSFESDFPVQLREREHQEYTLTVGSGSARMQLESFGGTVRLRRSPNR